MATDSTQFRSALNGFNRMDVVNFIESLTLEHKQEIKALQSAQAKLTDQCAQRDTEIEKLTAQIELLHSEKEQALAECEALQEQIVVLAEEAVAAAEAEEEDITDADALELEAYRRAEAAERNAVQRANRLYEQMSAVCSDLNGRMSRSDQEITLLHKELTQILERMQESVADLQLIFDEAPDKIKALGADAE